MCVPLRSNSCFHALAAPFVAVRQPSVAKVSVLGVPAAPVLELFKFPKPKDLETFPSGCGFLEVASFRNSELESEYGFAKLEVGSSKEFILKYGFTKLMRFSDFRFFAIFG